MNETVFLQALHDSPNDEVTWLALADWLDEHGQGERAELIRLVRHLRTVPFTQRAKKRAELEDRVAGLLLAGVRPVVAELVNSIGMRLALIPPGPFRKGSPKGEPGRFNDELAHRVVIEQPFYLGVFPVTQAQYRAVMGTNPSHFCASGDAAAIVAQMQTDDFPVEMVSWDDAVEFCRRLSEREQKTYRLPSDDEWEYACRGGSASTGPTCFGASLHSTQANFNGAIPYQTDEGPYLQRPSVVGSYPPNAFGVYDMHGNVWEWVADAVPPEVLMANSDPPLEPGAAPHRRFRGGCWHQYGANCRSAFRSYDDPDARYNSVGFRVALSWESRT